MVLVANIGEEIATMLEIAFVVAGVYALRAWRQGKLTRELQYRIALFMGIVVGLVVVAVLAVHFMRP